MRVPHVRLGEIAQFVNGAAFKPDDWHSEGKRIIRIQNLTDSSKPFNRTQREVAANLNVQPGDLLVSWSATLGVFIWQGPDVALVNQHIFRVVPDPHKVDRQYLYYALGEAIGAMTKHLHGATMKHVNRNEFLGTTVPLPPLPEQRRIAEILDRADALRAKRRQAITKLDSLTQSIFTDMFGDSRTNPLGWNQRQLAEWVAGNDSINYGVVQPGDPHDQGVPLVRVSDFENGQVRITGLKLIAPEVEAAYGRSRLIGDEILVSCVGSVGQISFADERLAGANIARAVARIRLEYPECRHFVAAALRSDAVQDYFRNETRTVSQPTLNIKQLAATPIFDPPKDAQVRFCERAHAVAQSQQHGYASIEALDTLFATLQHRAFSGLL